MNLFRPRQAEADTSAAQLRAVRSDMEGLASEVRKVQTELRAFQLEAETLHAEVRKWMRRAVAAEKRAEAREDPAGSPIVVPPGSTVAGPARRMWGPRARRLARAGRPDPLNEAEESNGVHP